jgi:hypothetical protein
VDDDAVEVQQHPASASRALTVVYPEPVGSQRTDDVVRQAVKMARCFAADDHKEISELTDPT